ncbi:hypothetical protein C9J27_02490 [Photobacterium kishitanii]|uniref:Uncharacterized protein n=2 Tax=Photobacterium kishitanii TaxID=318456 RepID=A0A2T3KME0_9GAMM|nr:hypothetical protein C9J27_02490 [Photobacterium kishitanii]
MYSLRKMRINESSKDLLSKTIKMLKNSENAEAFVESFNGIGYMTKRAFISAIRSNQSSFNETNFKKSIAAGMIRVIHMHCATSDWGEAISVLETLDKNSTSGELSPSPTQKTHSLALAKEILDELGSESIEHKVVLKNFVSSALLKLKQNPNQKPLEFMLSELRESLHDVVAIGNDKVANISEKVINDKAKTINNTPGRFKL